MKKYLDELCEEELALLDRRNVMKQTLRNELDDCLADVQKQKELAAEQDRLLTENVHKFQKEKAVSIVILKLLLIDIDVCQNQLYIYTRLLCTFG